MHRFTLEKYKNWNSRYTCPNCKHPKEFTRYIDTETGEYLADHVGRCNRQVKCKYHYTPKEYFFYNPDWDSDNRVERWLKRKPSNEEWKKKTKPDLIPKQVLIGTLRSYDRNNLILFLQSRFEPKEVRDVIRRYLIGTWHDGKTVFWQIDAKGLIRTGKLISYSSETGKRIKSRTPSWVHAEIKRQGEVFRLKQCMFGEHLLRSDQGATVGIVESEKTAIVASIFMPELIWLATGGCGNLNLNRIQRAIKARRTILFPDSSKFEDWSAKAKQAMGFYNLDMKASDLLERRLTDVQKKRDYDIADFLLANKKVRE